MRNKKSILKRAALALPFSWMLAASLTVARADDTASNAYNAGANFSFVGNDGVRHGLVDTILRNQVNQPNGVAGLDASGNFTGNISNSILSTKNLNLTDPAALIAFGTSSTGLLVVSYDQPSNTLKFAPGQNNTAGRYKFSGTITADAVNLSAGSLLNVGNFYSGLTGKTVMPRIGMADVLGNTAVPASTMLLGTAGSEYSTYLKASCFNGGSGEFGGACYSFVNGVGTQGTAPFINDGNVGGSAQALPTTGVNLDVRSGGLGPIDTIGGNVLTTNADGSHSVTGVQKSYPMSINAGDTWIYSDGTIPCGPGNTCVASSPGVTFTAPDGSTVNEAPFHLSRPAGNNGPGTPQAALLPGYSFKVAVPANTTFYFKVLARDGVAYAVAYKSYREVEVYPKLSAYERSLIQSRMAVYSNYVNGMYKTLNPTSTQAGASHDMPNYYYSYFTSFDDSTGDDGTGLFVDSNASFYTGTSDASPGFTTLTSATNTPVTTAPGQNAGDILDVVGNVLYTKLDGSTVNSQFGHYYTQPAIFIGGSVVNTNMRGVQTSSAGDSFTQEFDNQYLFDFSNSSGSPITSRGMTMKWAGGTALADDSWMLNLNGNGIMPQGLVLGGVQSWNNRRLISTDAGFQVYSNVSGSWLNGYGGWVQNAYQPAASLGMVRTFNGTTSLTVVPQASGNIGDTSFTVAGKFPDVFIRQSVNLYVSGTNAASTAALGTNQYYYTSSITYNATANVTTVNLAVPLVAAVDKSVASFRISIANSFGVLSGYESADASGTSTNTSFHFGMTYSDSNIGALTAPGCLDNASVRCTSTNQIIFDPAGLQGALAIGYGRGANTILDLIDMPDGSIVASKRLEIGKSLTHNNPAFVFTDFQTISLINGSSGNYGWLSAAGMTAFNGLTLRSGITDLYPGTAIRFETGSADSNNTSVNLGYDLTNNRVYFTNFHYGNSFYFNGSIEATGGVQGDNYVQVGISTGRSVFQFVPLDFQTGTSNRNGVKLGSGLLEYSDKYHAETPLGDFTGWDASGNPVVTISDNHSWMTYSASFNFYSASGTSTAPTKMLSVSSSATVANASFQAPLGSFDQLAAKTSGGVITVASPIVYGSPYTFATLPTNAAASTEAFCSDCYSLLRDSSYTKTGIKVLYNGSDWVDMTGNLVQH